MKDPRRLTLNCARCGQAAAEFALLPAEVAGSQPWAKGDRLERAHFLGAVTQFGTYEALLPLFDALSRQDFAAAQRIDPDLVAFHCHACNAVYCEQCWGPRREEFDDGFYDCAYATCPAGHEQIVDD